MQAPRILYYYAKVEKIGSDWLVRFPDLPHLTACGNSFWDALARAETALNAALEADSERQTTLPAPSDFQGSLGYFPILVRTSVLQAYLRKEDPRA
jgi:predicted RNase H-like HicB family nuclease